MGIFEKIKQSEDAVVEEMVAENPALVEERNAAGLRPVMMALYYGRKELAEELRDRMESVDVWEAAALGELETVASAVEQDRSLLDATSPDGFTPLGLAAFFGQVDVLTWLLTEGADPNKPAENEMAVYPINSATAHREKTAASMMVSLLVAQGAEVNVAQHGGWTPLHQAASHGDMQMVQFLLESGADPSLESDDRHTAADMAMENKFGQVAGLLEETAERG
jgi:ankyrin repeat protein